MNGSPMTTPPVAPQTLAADEPAAPAAVLNTHLTHADQQAYDRLATLVAAVRVDGRCLMVNAAFESAMGQSRRKLVHGSALDWFTDPAPLCGALQSAADHQLVVHRFEAALHRPLAHGQALPVHVIASPTGHGGRGAVVMVEMTEIERQVRVDRETHMYSLLKAHQALLRNLAHEIRNPLGGIRGSAQLLALELASPELRDYTDVIIREADRLQGLLDRLLAPHRGAPQRVALNIHEVCEHVRALVLAEHPNGLQIRRDYDTSLPDLRGDRERLIQALLNIVRNAAQALSARIAAGDARIVLRTRVARQVTLGGQRFRLALALQVEDNGPGVPEALREHVFQPLVTGSASGHGLGLTLAQTLVQQHGGTIECDSQPGATCFTLLLPLPGPGEPAFGREAP